MTVQYKIHLLGPVKIEKEGQTIRQTGSRKGLALLGYLTSQDRPVQRGQLAALFWPDKTETRGRRNLSRELSQLATYLPDCFSGDYYTVGFQPGSRCWLDTWAFAELAQAGLTRDVSLSDQPAKLAASAGPGVFKPDQLAAAVDLYRADFMDGVYLNDCPEYETWLVREQDRWRQQVITLPLLPHALLELWERRQAGLLTTRTYYASGGVTGAIAQRAEALYNNLNPAQQTLVRRLMLRLTHPGEGTEDTRRRIRKSELQFEAEATETTLQHLVEARLVVTGRDSVTGQEMIEVSHEALIRGWDRLRAWLARERFLSGDPQGKKVVVLAGTGGNGGGALGLRPAAAQCSARYRPNLPQAVWR